MSKKFIRSVFNYCNLGRGFQFNHYQFKDPLITKTIKPFNLRRSLQSNANDNTQITIHHRNQLSLDHNQFKNPLITKTIEPLKIYSIDNFLTNHECERILNQGEQLGFEPATVDLKLKRHKTENLDHQTTVTNRNIRSNDRVIFSNSILASQIDQRPKTN